VHLFWDSPLAEAPPSVRVATNLWQRLNPHWEVRIYSLTDMQYELKDWPHYIMQSNIQARSDALRIHLLAQYGGVWADASVMPARPLDTWIHESAGVTGFFGFRLVGMDRPLASWFLAAEKGCKLSSLWRDLCVAYWTKPHRNSMTGTPFQRRAALDPICALCASLLDSDEQYPYLWFHYLFRVMCHVFPEAESIWRNSPRPRAAPSLRASILWRRKEYDLAITSLLQNTAPVVKLNWRHNWSPDVLDAFASAARAR
jgi:hypothetical protein